MDESSALKVVAMRAVETTDTARTLWTDEDRAWASRAAAEVIGAEGAPEAFLARRATLASRNSVCGNPRCRESFARSSGGHG